MLLCHPFKVHDPFLFILKSLTEMKSCLDVYMSEPVQESKNIEVSRKPAEPVEPMDVDPVPVAPVVHTVKPFRKRFDDSDSRLISSVISRKDIAEAKFSMSNVYEHGELSLAKQIEDRVRYYESEQKWSLNDRQGKIEQLQALRENVIPNADNLRGRMRFFFNPDTGMADEMIASLSDSQLQALTDAVSFDPAVYHAFLMHAFLKYDRTQVLTMPSLFGSLDNAVDAVTLTRDAYDSSQKLLQLEVKDTVAAIDSGFLGRMLGATETKEAEPTHLTQFIKSGVVEEPIAQRLAKSLSSHASLAKDLAQKLGVSVLRSFPEKSEDEKKYRSLMYKHNSMSHKMDWDYGKGMDATDMEKLILAYNSLPKQVQDGEDWGEVKGIIQHAFRSKVMNDHKGELTGMRLKLEALQKNGIMPDRMNDLLNILSKDAYQKSWIPSLTKKKVGVVLGGLALSVATLGLFSYDRPKFVAEDTGRKLLTSGLGSSVADPSRNISQYTDHLGNWTNANVLGTDAPQLSATLAGGWKNYHFRSYNQLGNFIAEARALKAQHGDKYVEDHINALGEGQTQTLDEMKGLLESTSRYTNLLASLPLDPTVAATAKSATAVAKTVAEMAEIAPELSKMYTSWSTQKDLKRIFLFMRHGGDKLAAAMDNAAVNKLFGYGESDSWVNRGWVQPLTSRAAVFDRPMLDTGRNFVGTGVNALKSAGATFLKLDTDAKKRIMINTVWQNRIGTKDRTPADEFELFVNTVLTDTSFQERLQALIPSVPAHKLGPDIFYDVARKIKEWKAGDLGVALAQDIWGTEEGLRNIVESFYARCGGDPVIMGKVNAGLLRIHEAPPNQKADEIIRFTAEANELNLYIAAAAVVNDNVDRAWETNKVSTGENGVLEHSTFFGPQTQVLEPGHQGVLKTLMS